MADRRCPLCTIPGGVALAARAAGDRRIPAEIAYPCGSRITEDGAVVVRGEACRFTAGLRAPLLRRILGDIEASYRAWELQCVIKRRCQLSDGQMYRRLRNGEDRYNRFREACRRELASIEGRG